MVHNLLLIFLLLLLRLSFSASAQTYSNVSLGASLTAGGEDSSWLSPSGEFAFGFHAIKNQGDFLLAIWYDKIPEKTVVWYANGDKPAPRESKVQLTLDGKLQLNSPQGQEIWSTQSSTAGNANYAAMLDTGNFVLVDGNSVLVWESFKYPSDTILPSQVLELGRTLSSRQQPTNYSRGRFQLRLLGDGNLVMNSVALPSDYAYAAYYVSDTYRSGHQVVFNESTATIHISNITGAILLNLTVGSIPSTKTHYHLATMDFNGIFTQYARPKSSMSSNANENWSIVWSMPDDICSFSSEDVGEGVCGYNSICRIVQYRPVCQCPNQYSLVDSTNTFSGCKPDFILEGCNGNGSESPEVLYRMEELLNMDWPKSSIYNRLYPYTDIECQNSCLYDCQCAAANIDGGFCWKKTLPFRNGRQTSNISVKGFIKVPRGNITQRDHHATSVIIVEERNRGSFSVIAAVLLGSSMLFNLIFLAAFLMMAWTHHKKVQMGSRKSLEVELLALSTKES